MRSVVQASETRRIMNGLLFFRRFLGIKVLCDAKTIVPSIKY